MSATKAEKPHSGAPYPALAVAAVLFASLTASIDGRFTAVALADIRGGLGLSFDEGAWLSTAATAPQIFIAPAVAWLTTAFGLRRVLGLPAAAYGLVSFAIPFVSDYPILLTLTVLHGLLLGTFVPATMMIIFKTLPPRWWMPLIVIYATRVGFSLDVSHFLVGVYEQHFGWPALYWQGTVVGPVMAVLAYLGTPPLTVDRGLMYRADWGGMMLLGASLAMVYSGLDQGNRLDWSNSGTVISLLVLGVALFAAFLANEVVVKEPWARFKGLFSPGMGLSLVVVVLFSVASLSNSSLVPNFLGAVRGMRPEQVGELLLVSGAIPTALLIPFLIFVLRYVDARWTAMAGLFIFAVANLSGTQITGDWARDDFVGIVFATAVGQALALTSLIIIGFSHLRTDRTTAVAAYVHSIRLGSTEIGIALMSTWLRVREQIHSYYLGINIDIGGADVVAAIDAATRQFFARGADEARSQAVASLAARIQRESNVLAYIDAFWLCFWAAIAALLVLALVGVAPKGPFSPVPFRSAESLFGAREPR